MVQSIMNMKQSLTILRPTKVQAPTMLLEFKGDSITIHLLMAPGQIANNLLKGWQIVGEESKKSKMEDRFIQVHPKMYKEDNIEQIEMVHPRKMSL